MAQLQHPPTRLSYRPDIDGLRAIAVLLVVLEHLRTRFTGGYVGVDVFFVISGYLISAIMLQEFRAGEFSILSFYERRIRRIFPALFAVLAGTALLAYHYFLPAEIADYARSMLAALFSVSNLLFWRQAGYFDTVSELKPLLHTWSLAVEEQFYILFPLFLLCARRFFWARLRAAIVAIALISFAAACLWMRRDASAAFFLAPLRAWELLAGTILSEQYLPPLRSALARNTAALLGLACIFVPALAYTSRTPFPGLAAVPPCLGAALIILAGEHGLPTASRPLAWRPVVFVGLISYSLYLWHWPLLVFQNTSALLVNAPETSRTAKAAIFIASLVIAAISWRLVELPFRKGRLRPPRRTLFLQATAGAVCLTAAAAAMVLTGGLPSRLSPEARQVAAYAAFNPAQAYRQNACFTGVDIGFAGFRPDICLSSAPGRSAWLLLGDSHAADLYPGLTAVFPEVSVLQANNSGCRPYLQQPEWTTTDCRQMSGFIFNTWLPAHHVDKVLLAGRWEDAELPELHRTVQWLQQRGMVPVIIGPSPEFYAPLPRILALSLRTHNSSAIARARVPETAALDRNMAQTVREDWHVQYISAFEDLCPATIPAKSPEDRLAACPLYARPGVPLLFDTDHYTVEGATLLARQMRQRGQLP